MSFENGSTSQVPDHNPTVSSSDSAELAVSAVSGADVDGLLDGLGLNDVATVSKLPLAPDASPAIETEIEMSDVPGGDSAPHLPEAAESPLLDQLDELSTTLAGLEETDVAESHAADFAAEREALAAERQRLAADRRALEEASAALQQREAEWTARTAEPMTPAESSHAAALQILEAEIVRRTAELNQQRRAIEKERAALDEAQSNWRIEFKTQKETLDAELQKFTTRQRMIRQEQAEWDKKSAEFNAERTRLREQKQSLQQQAAELAAERERVEMQAATILVGARVAEITVNERNSFAAERDAIQAERDRFAELQRELDDQRAALEQQQQTLEREKLEQVEAQAAAREAMSRELETLQARLADAEAAAADASRRADEAHRLLEERTAELTAELAAERAALAEERSRWAATRPAETTASAAAGRESESESDSDCESGSGSADGPQCHGDIAGRESQAETVATVVEVSTASAASADDDADRPDATPEERAAAALRRLGIPPEDQPEPPEALEATCGEERASADESGVVVAPEPEAGPLSDPPDEVAHRYARLRAEAMGHVASPTDVAREAAPSTDDVEALDPAPVLQYESLPPPRVVIDKEEVREHLASLREVSQLSVQNDLSRHQCKVLRSSILMRTLIALVSFAGAFLFLSGDLVGHETSWMYGCLLLIVGIYMAFDAFQKSVQLGLIAARRQSERRLANAGHASRPTGTERAEIAAS